MLLLYPVFVNYIELSFRTKKNLTQFHENCTTEPPSHNMCITGSIKHL